QQGRDERRVLPGGWLAAPTWPADAAGREGRLAGLQLNDALAHGRLADPSDLRDRAHAAVPQQPRFDRQRQALLALVQMRQQDLEPGRELTTDLHRYAHAAHTTPASPKTENDTLFRSGFCGAGSAGSPDGRTPRSRRGAAPWRRRSPPGS